MNPSVHFPGTAHGVRLSCFHAFSANRKRRTRFCATGANIVVSCETSEDGAYKTFERTNDRGNSLFRRRKVIAAHPFFYIPFFTDCNARFKIPSTVSSSGNVSRTFSVKASACFGA